MRKYFALFLLVASLVSIASLSPEVGAQGTCAIQYVVSSKGMSYPGATVTIVNNFTNTGSLAMQVTGITLTTDFGTFSAPSSSLPLSVPVSSSNGLDFDIQVPSSASQGSHTVSASAAFQCNEGGTWVTPNISPLVLNTTFSVGANPGISAAIGLAIIGAIIALVVVVVVLVVKLRKRKPSAPMPPPTYTPPSSPPPGQNPPTQ